MEITNFIETLQSQRLLLLADADQLLLRSETGKLNANDINNYPELIAYIKAKKADLLAYLRQSPMTASLRQMQPNIAAVYPLSPLQEGMLFHSLYDQQAADYIEQFGCILTGPVDLTRFGEAWQAVLARHTILRTSFHSQNLSVSLQCVHQQVELPIRHLDYTSLDADQQAVSLAQWLDDDFRAGFDLQRPPLMRLTLIKLGDQRHRLVWTAHHLIIDGWSLPIVLNELVQNYQCLLRGERPGLGEDEDRYEAFINYLKTKPVESAKAFWQHYLTDVETPTLLIGQSTNPAQTDYPTTRLALSSVQTERVVAFTRTHQLTVNTLLQATWGFLLASHTGRSAVTFGTTVSGRPGDLANVEQKVGLFINTLPLTTRLNGDQSVLDWLETIQRHHTEAREFQHTSLTHIQDWVDLREGLFNTLLVVENYPAPDAFANPNAFVVSEPTVREQTNYPLTLVAELTDVLTVEFRYKASVFADEQVTQLAAQFEQVLGQLVEGPFTQPVARLTALLPEQAAQVLRLGTPPLAEYDGQTFFDFYDRQVSRQPHQIATIFAEQTLSLAELDEQVQRMVGLLVAQGVGPGQIVGVCMHRTPLLLVSMLGILRTGAAYAPIDPNYPDGRIDHILDDAGITLLLCEEALLRPAFGQRNLRCLLPETQLATAPPTAPDYVVQPTDLAYILYTSGSTGKPKGVKIHHGGLLNYIMTALSYFSADKPGQSGTYFNVSIGFDMSISIVFPPLLVGKPIVMGSGPTLTLFDDPAFLRHAPYDFLTMTPTQFTVLDQALQQAGDPWIADRLVLGGEPLLRAPFQRLRDKGFTYELINIYGPTETTVAGSWYRFGMQEEPETVGGCVVIGRPMTNVPLFVLDARGQLALPGVVGDLYIGGIQVSAGYHNRPDLTQERFIDHEQGRLYATGDKVAWQPSGQLGSLGRTDDQVKLRGFRIELGEIETVLQRAPGVKTGVVGLRKDGPTVTGLVGYVEVTETYQPAEVLAHLQHHLAAYMVPSALIVVDKIPQSPNGKADRRALSALDLAPDPLPETPANGDVSPDEETLLGIWQHLLPARTVGLDDNFFSLGGDSIGVIQLVSRARHSGLNLTAKDVFVNPTVRQLARCLSATATVTGEQGPLVGSVPLLPIQEYFLEQAASSHYNQAVLVGLNKQVDAQQLSEVVRHLIARHDALRLRYEQTPTGWQQTYGQQPGQLTVVDMNHVAGTDLSATVTTLCERYQRSLSLTDGPLYHFVLIKTPADVAQNRFFMVVHHLAIDGISWRILLEDLNRYLDSVMAGQSLKPDTKTHSYRQWAKTLTAYAQSETVQQQRPYWEAVLANPQPLPTDWPATPGTLADTLTYTITLDADRTDALLRTVPTANRVEINDVLLTALWQTITAWSGHSAMQFGLESHGRESIDADTDTTQTLGWFTNLYPVRLDLGDPTTSPAQLLQTAHRQLRAIPDKGLGYGALRYLSDDPAVRTQLARSDVWQELIFNYLGQLDSALPESRWLHTTDETREPVGARIDPARPFTSKVEVVAYVLNAQLVVGFTYSTRQQAESTIAQIATRFETHLTHLIAAQPMVEDLPPLPGSNPHLVCLQPRGSQPPVFIIPGGYGNADWYADLALALGTEQPVFGVQTWGTLPGEQPHESIEAIAGQNLGWIMAQQPEGPFRLIGHSFGSRVAYEMALQLEAMDHEVEFLAVIDAPVQVAPMSCRQKADVLIDRLQTFATQNALPLPEGWQPLLIQQLPMTTVEATWAALEAGMQPHEGISAYLHTFGQELKLLLGNLNAGYTPPRPLARPISLLKAQVSDWADHAPDLGWLACTDALRIVTAPGDHLTMLIGDRAIEAGRVLKAQLRDVQNLSPLC